MSSPTAKYRPPKWRNERRRFQEPPIKYTIDSEPESDAAAKARARRERFSQPTKKDDYGLVSRGEDDRLRVDAKARKDYFQEIQLRSIKLVQKSPNQKQYLQDILDVVDRDVYDIYTHIDKQQLSPSSERDSEDSILMSLRKLREALLPLKPDQFTKRVFLFSVRMAVLTGKYQAFLPSVLHLLDVIHPMEPLNSQEFCLVASLYVYHTAHFNNDIGSAYKILYDYIPDEKRAWNVLRSLASENYVAWCHFKQEEPYAWLRMSMSQGHTTVGSKAVQSISKSYMSLKQTSVERLIGLDWDEISGGKIHCGWSKGTDGVITIRQRKKQGQYSNN